MRIRKRRVGNNIGIMSETVKVLLFSALSYVALFVISKLLGKKQIAELDFIDYVTGISIGSIAAEMATETDKPFYHYLIAMAIFFLFDLAVSLLGQKTNFFKRFLRGVPIILIDKGKVDFEALKKCKIDFYDMLGLARDKGFFDIDEIEYAIFETNGDLSILAADNSRQVKREDFEGIPAQTPKLTSYLIVDGQVSAYGLKESKITKQYLLDEIDRRHVPIKQILYAVYDDQTGEISITEKEGELSN